MHLLFRFQTLLCLQHIHEDFLPLDKHSMLDPVTDTCLAHGAILGPADMFFFIFDNLIGTSGLSTKHLVHKGNQFKYQGLQNSLYVSCHTLSPDTLGSGFHCQAAPRWVEGRDPTV